MPGDRADLLQSLGVKRHLLNKQVAESIEALISEKRLPPKTQLPSEREIAQHLGVSRATVREGIRLLEQRGLVEMRMGSGTYVTEVASKVVVDSITRYVNFGRSTYADLVELRAALEPQMAALAAERATDEDIATLWTLADAIEKTASGTEADLDKMAQADTAFHEALAAATHNELMRVIADALHAIMVTWIRTTAQRVPLEEGARGHRKVLEAIALRSPQLAEETMRECMRVVHTSLRRLHEKGNQ